MADDSKKKKDNDDDDSSWYGGGRDDLGAGIGSAMRYLTSGPKPSPSPEKPKINPKTGNPY